MPKGGGLTKPMQVSDDLAAIIGVEEVRLFKILFFSFHDENRKSIEVASSILDFPTVNFVNCNL